MPHIKNRQGIKQFLTRFAPKGEAVLSFPEFRCMCEQLFDTDEVDKNEEKVRKIFSVFDVNGDGVLNTQEWKRCYEKWIRSVLEPVNVLLVVDVQNDFIDGSLALRNSGYGQDGADVVQPINRLLKEGHWGKVIYSLDWHPENHISFFENLCRRKLHPDSEGKRNEIKPFDQVLFLEPNVEQKLWPKHCVMNTWGAELHKDLLILPGSEQIKKGHNSDVDSYSVFSDNNKEGRTELQHILSKIGATNLFVCGLAYDVCVKETCLDGLKSGYPVAVIDDCCRGVNLDGISEAKRSISDQGGLIVESDCVLRMVNEDVRNLVMAEHLANALKINENGIAETSSALNKLDSNHI